MATQELNVKFKVDASDVTSGSKEAKDKVKDAANQMAQDVKSSSDKMEQSFKDVAKSTDAIKDATKTATTAVKDMETQVDSSAKNMEKSMDAVSKKMNVMMGARGAATALRMGGNLVQSIGPTVGMDEDTAKTTGAVLTGAASGIAAGAQLGTVVGGPGMGTAIGAAAGGLIGAGAELFKAGKELQMAAKSEQEKAAIYTEQARKLKEQEANKQLLRTVSQKPIDEIYADRDAYTEELRRREAARERAIAELDPTKAKSSDFQELEGIENQIETQRALVEAVNKIIAEREAPLKERREEAAAARQATEAKEDAANKAYAEYARKQVEANRRKKEREEADAVKEAEDKEKAEKNAKKDALSDKLKEGQTTLADLQSELNGKMRSRASGPTDELTKIGGGVGYTSYNNSVEGVQKTISNDLKTLIKNQTIYNANIETKLQELIDKPAGSAEWREGE